MPGTLNAHRLLRGSKSSSGYLQNLNVDAANEKQLRHARDTIRQALREGFARLQKAALVEQRHIALAAAMPALRPRFRMQGSAAYHTLNDPAHKPPQEIDYDDGVYLPASFVTGNGAARPVVGAGAYFKAVETILTPVCKAHGWTVARTKISCVRVDLSAETYAHIDLPLYAIPDEEFTRLTEAALADAQKTFDAKAQDADDVFSKSVYSMLPADRIMLAQRDGTWIESDPRKIEDWFKAAIDDHDEALRYVCRYVKGWRDFQWDKCGLTSLAIMACVVKAYDQLEGTLPEDRDDTALLAIAEKMSDLLAKPIENPVIAGQWLDKKWTPEDRQAFVQRARQLHAELSVALDQNLNKAIAISTLRNLFGSRIPDDVTLLTIDGVEREVMSYAPAVMAAPKVVRSQSG